MIMYRRRRNKWRVKQTRAKWINEADVHVFPLPCAQSIYFLLHRPKNWRRRKKLRKRCPQRIRRGLHRMTHRRSSTRVPGVTWVGCPWPRCTVTASSRRDVRRALKKQGYGNICAQPVPLGCDVVAKPILRQLLATALSLSFTLRLPRRKIPRSPWGRWTVLRWPSSARAMHKRRRDNPTGNRKGLHPDARLSMRSFTAGLRHGKEAPEVLRLRRLTRTTSDSRYWRLLGGGAGGGGAATCLAGAGDGGAARAEQDWKRNEC